MIKKNIKLKGKPYYIGTKTIAVHPAITINEYIEYSEYVDLKYIVKNTSLNRKQLKRFLSYKEFLTKRIAVELSKVTGISIGTFVRLEEDFEKKYLKVLRELNKNI